MVKVAVSWIFVKFTFYLLAYSLTMTSRFFLCNFLLQLLLTWCYLPQFYDLVDQTVSCNEKSLLPLWYKKSKYYQLDQHYVLQNIQMIDWSLWKSHCDREQMNEGNSRAILWIHIASSETKSLLLLLSDGVEMNVFAISVATYKVEVMRWLILVNILC